MKTRKIPLRRCLASNQQYPKKELLRIVKTPDNTVVIDQSGKQNGRGAYLKLSQENIDKLIKSKALERAFECEVPAELYRQLQELLEKTR